jgi:hypothetical protein
LDDDPLLTLVRLHLRLERLAVLDRLDRALDMISTTAEQRRHDVGADMLEPQD